MSIKITKLELENVKRIKAVTMEPTQNGLTIVGGNNEQGKTSVLDAIAWALGGNKFKPSEPRREGSMVPPQLHIELSNGLIVERSGKNSDLKVIDPAGNKAGQQLLDSFISQLALDLPKFMEASDKEKADTLLRIIGVGDKLYALEQEEKTIYNKRHSIGQIADQKKKYVAEMKFFPGLPEEPVSAGDLIRQQQTILARNGENERLRQNLKALESETEELDRKIAALTAEKVATEEKLTVARKTAKELKDESTEELESNISDIDELNRKIRVNLDREKAAIEADSYGEEYEDLTENLESVRKSKTDLLAGADLPLPELSVVEGELTYQGYKWDNMSGSARLRVATSIVRKLNPDCGFVLLDRLEQMDTATLKEFGDWLAEEGLQVIATRVSTGGECHIIIEDGYVVEEPATAPKWKAGEF